MKSFFCVEVSLVADLGDGWAIVKLKPFGEGELRYRGTSILRLPPKLLGIYEDSLVRRDLSQSSMKCGSLCYSGTPGVPNSIITPQQT